MFTPWRSVFSSSHSWVGRARTWTHLSVCCIDVTRFSASFVPLNEHADEEVSGVDANSVDESEFWDVADSDESGYPNVSHFLFNSRRKEEEALPYFNVLASINRNALAWFYEIDLQVYDFTDCEATRKWIKFSSMANKSETFGNIDSLVVDYFDSATGRLRGCFAQIRWRRWWRKLPAVSP